MDGIGLLFGYNIGTKMGMIEPEIQVNMEPDRYPSFVAAILGGVVLSVLVGLGVKYLAKKAASQRNLRGWTWQTWVAMLGAALVSLLLIAGDVALQMSSMMSQAEMTSLSGETHSPMTYLLMSMIFVIGYVMFKNAIGWADGLNGSARQVALQHIDKVASDEEARRRVDNVCKEASAAAHTAKVANSQFADAKSVYESACRDLNTRVIELASQRKDIPVEPNMDERLKLDEAELRAKAERIEFDHGSVTGEKSCYRAEELKRRADEMARVRAGVRMI
ncbi:MAG: hypothetical protein KF812_09795 [Fimbriimonadaceae bacterium]|nr:hypothetical protein [Fimbriimonadaceae bacterium]